MAQVKGLTVKINAVVLSPFDVQFCEQLDEPARLVFQQLSVSYRNALKTFVTMWNGPRLVLVACEPGQEGPAAYLSPTQFQWMVTQTNGHWPVVDLLIQKRLEHFERGRFRDARILSGDYKFDDA